MVTVVCPNIARNLSSTRILFNASLYNQLISFMNINRYLPADENTSFNWLQDTALFPNQLRNRLFMMYIYFIVSVSQLPDLGVFRAQRRRKPRELSQTGFQPAFLVAVVVLVKYTCILLPSAIPFQRQLAYQSISSLLIYRYQATIYKIFFLYRKSRIRTL